MASYLLDAISIQLFISLIILVVEVLAVHIGLVVCLIKFRYYRGKYQTLKDLKKFKEFVSKEVKPLVETTDSEAQSDESCFDNNGYLSIIKEKIVEKSFPAHEIATEQHQQHPLESRKVSVAPSADTYGEGYVNEEMYTFSHPNNQYQADDDHYQIEEGPPQYDEYNGQQQASYNHEPSQFSGIDTEKMVDFSRDQLDVDREEIATRTGADKLWVPNGFHGKTTVLNLYVTQLITSSQLQQLHLGQIGLEEIMNYTWRFLYGDSPVGGVLDIKTRETYNVSEAFENGLLSKKQAIMLLEAQACLACMINPKSGEKLRVEDALIAGYVSPKFKRHLLLAEQAVFGFEAVDGQILSLFDAMKLGMVPQGMAYRIMEVQFVTGGLICPRRRHRVPTNIALHSGLIDTETLGVLQNRQSGESYRKLYDTAQDDPESGFRVIYIDPASAVPKEPKSIDHTMFDEPVQSSNTGNKLETLAQSGMIDQAILERFKKGEIDESAVKEKLMPFVGGSGAIGGVLHIESGQIYSFAEALELRLIKRSVAIEFMQAQIATGGLINPKTGEKTSLQNGISYNWVPKIFEHNLLEAERAYKGFTIAGHSGPVPLVEAIRVGIVGEMQGTRFLEAQVATGGLVDPAYGYRIPLDMAKAKNLVDNRVMGLLTPETSEQKGYIDPQTGENKTYEELLSTCVKRSNIPLLQVTDRANQITQNQMVFIG